MKNALVTPDGYFFEQLPDGTYTDGDVTFNYDVSDDLRGVIWQEMDGQYCADGDGLLVVDFDGSRWLLVDQGDPVFAADTLADALRAGNEQLAEFYPEIYAEHVGEA